MLEAVVAGLLDEVKILRDNKVKFLAGICFVQFLLAIPMITQVRRMNYGLSNITHYIYKVCKTAHVRPRIFNNV